MASVQFFLSICLQFAENSLEIDKARERAPKTPNFRLHLISRPLSTFHMREPLLHPKCISRFGTSKRVSESQIPKHISGRPKCISGRNEMHLGLYRQNIKRMGLKEAFRSLLVPPWRHRCHHPFTSNITSTASAVLIIYTLSTLG